MQPYTPARPAGAPMGQPNEPATRLRRLHGTTTSAPPQRAVATPNAQMQTQRDPYAPTDEDRRHAGAMHRAWSAYHGVFHTGSPQWPLLWQEGKEPNPNIIINRCGPAVDTDVAWLFGESVSITLEEDAPDDAQTYVDKVWGVKSDEDSSDDDKMALLQELGVNGAITGCAFLKLLWEEGSGQEYPQLVVLDSQTVRVLTDPHNCKIPICYIIEYRVPDPDSGEGKTGTYRQVLQRCGADGTYSMTGLPDDQTTWEISDYFKGGTSQGFVLTEPETGKTNPTMWPYPWAPVDGCPHISQPNHYWGRPRLTPDVIHINEAICMVASNINKIGLRHAHPVLYTIKQGNNQKEQRHNPGTIMEVSSDVKAVEAYGDLEHLMRFEEDLRADFDEETHVPAQAFGRQKDIPRTPVSGVAIRLGYGPLMADITKERRTYGALIRRVTQHMLELKQKAWGQFAVSLGWQDPLPADDLQQAQVVQAADAIGIISKTTAAKKFGLDWDVEQAQMADEAKAAMQAQMQGAALPDATASPTPPAADDGPGGQQQPAAPGNSASEPGQAPPVNHPAAVAARAAAKAAGAAMKASVKAAGS